MKSKLETTLLASLCFFVLSCGNAPAPTQVKGGQNCDGCETEQKPNPAVAPHYSVDQFKVGQWIQWKGVASSGAVQCLKWTFQNRTSYRYKILAQFSGDCQSWDENYVEHISFNAQTGEILEDSVETEDSTKPGTLKTIFGHLYGSSDSVVFTSGTLKIGSKTYPAFHLDQSSQYYLNQPKHPFHAVVLGWQESDQKSLAWKYHVVDSDPALPEATQE